MLWALWVSLTLWINLILFKFIDDRLLRRYRFIFYFLLLQAAVEIHATQQQKMQRQQIRNRKQQCKQQRKNHSTAWISSTGGSLLLNIRKTAHFKLRIGSLFIFWEACSFAACQYNNMLRVGGGGGFTIQCIIVIISAKLFVILRWNGRKFSTLDMRKTQECHLMCYEIARNAKKCWNFMLKWSQNLTADRYYYKMERSAKIFFTLCRIGCKI